MTTVHAIRGYVTKRIRARGRGAAIIGAAGTSLLSRGLSIITSLSTVPIVLHHLGPQRYGVWMAAIALSAFFTMADGGVTKGLIAEVAKAHGAHDRAAIRRLISSALTATVTFVVLLGVAAVLAVGAVDWTWAFNLSDPALGREARNTILTIVLCYGFSWIATVIREARVGMLQAAAVNLWDATGLALGFAGIAAAAHFGWGLVAIAGIWTGGPALMRAVSALWFLRTEGRDLVPTWRDVDAATCRRLVSAGSIFVIYALTTVLATQCDQVLIARFLGPEAVTQYTIVQRLFQQPQVLVMLGLVAQWPAYGEALGRGDTAWIRRHFRWSLPGYAAFAAVLAGLLVVFCDPILRLWVGGAVAAPPALAAAMGLYCVVATVANVFAYFYMSLAIYRRVLTAQLLLIAITLPLYLLLIPRLGSIGAVLAVTIGQSLAIVLPGLWSMNRMFDELQTENPGDPRRRTRTTIVKPAA